MAKPKVARKSPAKKVASTKRRSPAKKVARSPRTVCPGTVVNPATNRCVTVNGRRYHELVAKGKLAKAPGHRSPKKVVRKVKSVSPKKTANRKASVKKAKSTSPNRKKTSTKTATKKY